MNKTEMAIKLANKTGLTQREAIEVIDTIFSTAPGQGIIATELDAGRKVQVAGFGTFGTKHRSARQGRNPATGSTIMISAKKYPYFKAGKHLKDTVSPSMRRIWNPGSKAGRIDLDRAMKAVRELRSRKSEP